ncbi:MAG: hypothetical protein WCF17_01620 [Terracidiphilus sp.]
MLKISIHENTESIGFTLSGRLAGPWVNELDRAWSETAPRLGKKTLKFDLRDLTYSDSEGKRVLSRIYAQTKAELIAGPLWSQHLANEIKASNDNRNGNGTKGVAHGIS